MRTHEKNLPAKQAKAKKDPRLQNENENPQRPQGVEPPPPQGPRRTDRLSFPKQARLLCRGEFQAAKRGRRLVGKYLCVDLYSRGSASRLGISASAKYGDATERNRFKRLIREAFRLNRPSLPPADIHIIPRTHAKGATLTQVANELLELTAHDPQSRSEKGR